MYKRRCETMNGFKVHTSGAHFMFDESGVILSLFGDTCRKAIKLPTLVSYLSNLYEEARQRASNTLASHLMGHRRYVWHRTERDSESVSKWSEREESSSNYLFVIKRSGSLMTTKHWRRFISLRHKFMNFISFRMARDVIFFLLIIIRCLSCFPIPILHFDVFFWYSSSRFFFSSHPFHFAAVFDTAAFSPLFHR